MTKEELIAAIKAKQKIQIQKLEYYLIIAERCKSTILRYIKNIIKWETDGNNSECKQQAEQ